MPVQNHQTLRELARAQHCSEAFFHTSGPTRKANKKHQSKDLKIMSSQRNANYIRNKL